MKFQSEFKWLAFSEAIEKATLPGNDEVLEHIYKHFVKRHPTEWVHVVG